MENNNNAAANSNVNTEVNNNPAGANAGTEKTFTQEEVNNIDTGTSSKGTGKE